MASIKYANTTNITIWIVMQAKSMHPSSLWGNLMAAVLVFDLLVYLSVYTSRFSDHAAGIYRAARIQRTRHILPLADNSQYRQSQPQNHPQLRTDLPCEALPWLCICMGCDLHVLVSPNGEYVGACVRVYIHMDYHATR